MGDRTLNENKNVYFQARKHASVSNPKLFSRESAAEMLGISPYTLADYELGSTKVVPVDKVMLMADLYNAPELITSYCRYECPIHGFLPLATEEKNIQGIALRILKGFDETELRNIKRDLIDISEDGIISDDEIPKLKEILKNLEKIAETISELKLVGEKYLKDR